MKSFTHKAGFIFLSIVLFFTLLSQSLFNLLIPNVKVGYASSGRITKTIETTGIAHTTQVKTIYAQHGGKIISVDIETGGKVFNEDILLSYDKKDDETKAQIMALELERKRNFYNQSLSLRDRLAKASTDRYIILNRENEIKQIKEEMNSKQGDIDYLENQYNTYSQLYAVGGISQFELNTLENQLRQLYSELVDIQLNYEILLNAIQEENYRNELSLAEAESEKSEKLEDMNYTIEDAFIDCRLAEIELDSYLKNLAESRHETSLYEGFVQHVYVLEGQEIQNNEKICDVITPNPVFEAEFELSNEEATMVHSGDEVTIRYIGTQVNEISGMVIAVNNTGVTDNSKTIQVVFESEEIKDKQAVTLYQQESSGVYDYVIPNSALKYDGSQYYVFGVVKQEKLLGTEYYTRKIPVYIADKNSEKTALVGSVNLLESLVISSNTPLKDNQRIYVEPGDEND